MGCSIRAILGSSTWFVGMALEEIMKAVCGADKATLAKVSRVLKHEDEERPAAAGDAVEARLVTQREAARRLGISPTTVWRLIREGELQVVRVRGKQRVCLASVLKYAGVAQ